MKEKVINTRITAELYEKISQKASTQGKKVSTLLRELMEDSFDIADEVYQVVDQEIKNHLATEEKKQSGGESSMDSAPTEIIGYQDIILASPKNCLKCQKQIKTGEKAFLAITTQGLKPNLVICPACLKKN